MAAETTNESCRTPFLLGQPIWLADSTRPAERWDLAIREEEPEIEGLAAAHRPAPEEGALQQVAVRWKRIDRSELLHLAVSDGPGFRRVGIICGAGLGKTTNLQYLEAAINRKNGGFNRDLGFFLDLAGLPVDRDELLAVMAKEIKNRVGACDATIRQMVLRLLVTGRVTFLLDSLDQADPDPKGKPVTALRELVQGIWRHCRVWVSGRPYAFRTARDELQDMSEYVPWQFVRIGQLDEAECRFLLETAKRPGKPGKP